MQQEQMGNDTGHALLHGAQEVHIAATNDVTIRTAKSMTIEVGGELLLTTANVDLTCQYGKTTIKELNVKEEQMKQVEIDESVTLTLRQLGALAAYFGLSAQPVSDEKADLRVTIAHGAIPEFMDENDQLVAEQRGLFAFGVDDALEDDGIMLL